MAKSAGLVALDLASSLPQIKPHVWKKLNLPAEFMSISIPLSDPAAPVPFPAPVPVPVPIPGPAPVPGSANAPAPDISP